MIIIIMTNNTTINDMHQWHATHKLSSSSGFPVTVVFSDLSKVKSKASTGEAEIHFFYKKYHRILGPRRHAFPASSPEMRLVAILGCGKGSGRCWDNPNLSIFVVCFELFLRFHFWVSFYNIVCTLTPVWLFLVKNSTLIGVMILQH